jgi:hypothetical protein
MEGWIPHGRETPCNAGDPMQRPGRRNREQGYSIQVGPQAAMVLHAGDAVVRAPPAPSLLLF